MSARQVAPEPRWVSYTLHVIIIPGVGQLLKFFLAPPGSAKNEIEQFSNFGSFLTVFVVNSTIFWVFNSYNFGLIWGPQKAPALHRGIYMGFLLSNFVIKRLYL